MTNCRLILVRSMARVLMFVLIASVASASAQKTGVVSTMPASAAIISVPRPSYPDSAKKHGIGGGGVFVLHVDRHAGTVSSVSVQKSRAPNCSTAVQLTHSVSGALSQTSSVLRLSFL